MPEVIVEEAPSVETPVRGREPALPVTVRRMLPGAVVVLLTLWVLRPIQDPDTFWHLAAGDRLRETWAFSGPDPWSNSSTNVWVLHEWLPELLMSWTQQLLGLAGVAWLHSLAVAILALALWVACRRRASLLISAVVMAVTAIAMSGSLTPRPHLVTFILTVVSVDAWLRSARDGRARWWLVPLTWVWACSHGMWFIGIVIGVVTLLGLALDRTQPVKTWSRLALVCAASMLAAALTPAGPALLASPLQVNAYTKFVAEWVPPSINDAFFVAFLVLAGVVMLIWARRARQIPWTHIVLTGLAVALALKYSRTVAVGAAIMAPITAETLHAAARLTREKVGRAEVVVTTALAVLGLAVAGILAPVRAAQPAFGPAGLNATLAALPTGTVVCNDYAIGGWLIWAHPNVRPAIDGRTEVYPVDYVQQFIDFTRALPDWQKLPDRAGCSHALLPTKAAVVEALQAQLHWTKAAAADGYVLLSAPAA